MSGVEQSEAPASAEPGSANSAAPDAELSDEGPEEWEQEEADLADWSVAEQEEADLACGVEVTTAVGETLAEELDDDAAAQSERRAETLEVRGALCDLPAFLNVVQGEGMPQNAKLDQMKAMKARGVEHVR